MGITSTPKSGVLYTLNKTTRYWDAPGRDSLGDPQPVAPTMREYMARTKGTPVTPTPPSDGWKWSDTNAPWAYATTDVFTSTWPAGVTIVDIQTSSPDFYTNLSNTVAAAGKRVVVRLQAGVYHLKSFRTIGASGDPTYAFGFWFPNLQGLLGQGADQTYVQFDANSMTQAQLDKMATMTAASFAPLNMGFARFDGSASSPVLIAGITFQADDQQMLTTVASDVPVVVPQPAPHQGLVMYNGASFTVSYCRFRAAGRASTSAPPFEMGNLTSQRSTGFMSHCEFDGRLAPDLNPLQPRRCGVIMGNNETAWRVEDCWLHHSNVSRYAVNDQNSGVPGQYIVTRCKFEQITNTHNVDPNLNGGASLNGYTNATLMGWESCGGTVTLTDLICYQDNPFTDRQIAQHIQLTSPAGAGNAVTNPQGGRMVITRGEFHNSGFPSLDGYLCARVIPNTYWYMDGLATTIKVVNQDGSNKTAYVYTGSWPPSAAQLSAAGVTPATHYIVRTS